MITDNIAIFTAWAISFKKPLANKNLRMLPDIIYEALVSYTSCSR
jgi:hypothetical protein